MTINNLKADIKKASVRPKGIKVSESTWKKLKAGGLIEMKDAAAWGIIDLGFQLPFLDENIYVILDPEFEASGLDYELPPSAKA